jgi:hypothetical protein
MTRIYPSTHPALCMAAAHLKKGERIVIEKDLDGHMWCEVEPIPEQTALIEGEFRRDYPYDMGIG